MGRRYSTGALLTICLALLPVVAQADRAIVVGVDTYQHLADPETGQHPNLGGCVNDAQAMTAILRQYHFDVTVLVQEHATRQAILDALGEARDSGDRGRFLFYFAGHGTTSSDGDAAILPSDASSNTERFDLRALDLNRAIKRIPASFHSVLLDCCFSGAMMRSLNQLGQCRSRYFARRSSTRTAKELFIEANDQDGNEALAGGSGICYFTACRGDEQAAETDFNGVCRGVFTYYLQSQLVDGAMTLGDLQASVGGRVADRTRDRQHPTLSPSFVNTRFLGSEDYPVSVVHHTLWDDFNADHVDRSFISLTMHPDRSMINVGDKLTLHSTIGENGYLIILERGVRGAIHLLFPRSADVEDARVTAGQIFRIPTDSGLVYAPDASGFERVRALLLPTRESAEALLNRIGDGPGETREELKRELELMPGTSGAQSAFFTSDVIFEVAEVGH